MAQVKIKGRTDMLRIPNDKARKIKDRWMGAPERGVEKANKADVVDLGDWAGEYGQIASIEMDKAPAPTSNDDELKDQELAKKEHDRIRKLPAEMKAEMLEKFKLSYMMRNNFVNPADEVIHQAYRVQLEYFRTHPNEVHAPTEVYAHLLPPKRGSLADKMKI